MNLDSLSLTLAQITCLVSTLSPRKNVKLADLITDLQKLIELHGLEADRHLLQCLCSAANTTTELSQKASGTKTFPAEPSVETSTNLHLQLLKDFCTKIVNKPTFITTVCSLTNDNNQEDIFQLLQKHLNLSAVHQVLFALALKNCLHTDIIQQAQNYLRTSVPSLVQAYINNNSKNSLEDPKSGSGGGGLQDTTPELLHFILVEILSAPRDFGLTNESHTTLLRTLQSDFPVNLVPVVLAPLIYPEQTELQPLYCNNSSDSEEMTSEANSEASTSATSTAPVDIPLADLIVEIGYAFTATVEECRGNLVKFGGGGAALTPLSVARVVTVMCQTVHSLEDNNYSNNSSGGLKSATTTTTTASSSGGGGGGGSSDKQPHSTWNSDVFVKAINEIVPNFQWNNVVTELDHVGFEIKDRAGLILLMTTLRLGLQSLGFHQDAFPVEQLYRRWSNVESQFSLISMCLKNSDVFCFMDYPCMTVTVDVLKTPPGGADHQQQDSKDLANWRCLNLIECLLAMAEFGLYSYVLELFRYPIHNCPDVLTLALLQVTGSLTMLRQELFANLIPIFLVNHPNSAIVLHHAWHNTSTNLVTARSIIMHAMAEWYARSDCDQTRLSRILDVAQDLKALSLLLNAQNAQSYPFIIDLACLASRREYLKLEKWLADKIREHGEPFVMACVKFLHRRIGIGKPAFTADEMLAKANSLPNDTLTTLMICLQTCVAGASPECQEAIISVVSACTVLLKARQQMRAATSAPLPPPPPLPATYTSGGGGGGGVLPTPPVPPPPPPPPLPPSLSSVAANAAASAAIYGGRDTNMAAMAAAVFNMPPTMPSALIPGSPGSPSRILTNAPPLLQQSPVAGPSSVVLPPPQTPPAASSGGPPSSTASVGRPTMMQPPTTGAAAAAATSVNIDQQSIFNIFPDIAQNPISKDIEDEANSYFQRIFNHPPEPTLSIDEVLDMLKRFMDSTNKRERDVFSCMLRNLFEEYRFFPKYPDKELYITAQLFGGIIDRNILGSYIALGLALRFVLEALRKPEGTKMYYFGIAALDRFKSRLKEYHKYCEHVRAIPQFSEFPQHLQDYVEYGLQGMEPPNKPQGTVLPPSGNSGGGVTTPTAHLYGSAATTPKSGGPSGQSQQQQPSTSRPSIAATNINTLLVAAATSEKSDKLTTPPDNLQDKIAFIFNNLSQLNLKTKCDEMRELISEEYYAWLAQYLVMKRVSIELNFHLLYSNFLNTLNVPPIYHLVTRETFRNIRVLLRSNSASENYSDRSLLKNFGHWLGMLTLAKNKPILHVDLDLKSLLLEAYHLGHQALLFIVPFVAKIIEACARSKVFRPQNPWTMGIMNVLAELHQEHDLKLSLKFEIEVLCKNLDIDVTTLKPQAFLKDQEHLRKLECQLMRKESAPQVVTTAPPSLVVTSTATLAAATVSTSSSAVVMTNPTPPTVAQTIAGLSSLALAANQAQVVVPTLEPPRFNYCDVHVTNTAVAHTFLQQMLVVNPSIVLFQNQPHLKALVRQSVEHAIQEWIQPVVERSIKIALQTSEQIIRKDFALDPDENRMRACAHYLVRNLTAGMAMITCRDQLITAISAHQKQALLATIGTPNLQQKEWIEQAANVIAADNMELACVFVQKTAVEKALIEIDKRLGGDYELRKLARQEGRRYCDPITLSYQQERMPEPIRIKVGVITGQQMAVYEEFARNVPGFRLMNERLPILSTALSDLPLPPPPLPLPLPPPQQQQSQTAAMVAAAAAAQQVPPPPPPSAMVQLLQKQQQQQQQQQMEPNAAIVVSSSSSGGGAGGVLPQIALNPDELSLLYDKLAINMDQFMQAINTQQEYVHIYTCAQNLRDYIVHLLRIGEPAPHILIQKCVEGLQECLPGQVNDSVSGGDLVILRFKDVILHTLKTLQDPRVYGTQCTNKVITRALIDCRDKLRYNLEAVDALIRNGFVYVAQYDSALVQCADNGLNYMGVTFAMQLVQLYLIDERGAHILTESDVANTIEMLIKVHMHSRQPPEGLSTLIEILRQHSNPVAAAAIAAGAAASVGSAGAAGGTSGTTDPLAGGYFERAVPIVPPPNQHLFNGMAVHPSRPMQFEDPQSLVEKTDFLLREWINIYNQVHGRDSPKAFSHFVQQMNIQGILKTDELITRFFRLSTQLCVEAVYRIFGDKNALSNAAAGGVGGGTANNQMIVPAVRSKCYNTLDAFVRLVALLVKHSGDVANTTTKIHLLNKVLGIVASCLLQDHETRTVDFNQLPYHRIFTMLFLELNAPEPVLEALNLHVLTAYCHTYHILRPSKAAAFCYAWLELISHRVFIGRMLASTPQQKCWPLYAELLVDLFRYLAPFLRNAELAKPVTVLYRGTLRVLLVLLHDFPEFLCDYHYTFCDVIPPNCIQMRNLILSAFPRNMRLPDPFTPNLKVDMLPEIGYSPRIQANVAALITPPQFRKDLESYLKVRAPVTFLSELRTSLQLSRDPDGSGIGSGGGGCRYNVPLLNALVLHVGMQAIAYTRHKGHTPPTMSTIAHSAHMDIFQNLAVDLDTEGRYLFLNAIANQLRYPNSHTHYFSCTLLYLFAEANTEAIQEQITRVLMERLIVNRPHPWGLLITFIELIKNPTYKFWTHEFVHCAPEIEKLFESVARSCMVSKTTIQAQDNDLHE